MPLAYNIIVNTGSIFSDSWKYINGILHPLLTIFCVIFFTEKGKLFFLVKLRGRRPPLFTRAPGLKVLPQGESIIQRYFSLLLTTLTYHSSPTFTWLFIQISFFFRKIILPSIWNVDYILIPQLIAKENVHLSTWFGFS